MTIRLGYYNGVVVIRHACRYQEVCPKWGKMLRNQLDQVYFGKTKEMTSASNEGLAECKARASNLKRIQVRDIIKEVEDYLKTYSSAGMDISCITRMKWSRTNLGVRNLAYLCDMLNEIGQLNIDVNEDTCTWSLGPNGTFTVKDARYRIDQNIIPTLAHATTWDKSIPRKLLLGILSMIGSSLGMLLKRKNTVVFSSGSLNALTEEIVAYEKESDKTHTVKKLNALCTPESFVTNSIFEYSLYAAEAVSKYNYLEFGDVVSFDATFKTNKYKMVIVPFATIDNHKKCVTVATGLLKNESTKSYIWLLKAFIKAFRKAPSIVVTDQDGAMRNAIEAEFVGSKHRLCMWHITQKLPAKVGKA
ncbi:protein FAR1-related sequence 5 [Tanacetum coccineum]